MSGCVLSADAAVVVVVAAVAVAAAASCGSGQGTRTGRRGEGNKIRLSDGAGTDRAPGAKENLRKRKGRNGSGRGREGTEWRELDEPGEG